tara:strand:- start:1274 stop:1435 length:162 start_codon:yes stop_codon:yes gene_type:complete
MAKNITIKGDNPADELKRYNAMAAINKEATTEELTKLQTAMKKPELRNMLKMI